METKKYINIQLQMMMVCNSCAAQSERWPMQNTTYVQTNKAPSYAILKPQPTDPSDRLTGAKCRATCVAENINDDSV